MRMMRRRRMMMRGMMMVVGHLVDMREALSTCGLLPRPFYCSVFETCYFSFAF